jgi:purine-nucleoside phosphorylase
VTSLLARLDEAAAFVRARATHRPTVGVVLGSGLGTFADELSDAVSVPFASIPHFPASTVVGHGGALVLGRCGSVPVAVMKGRVHHYEGYSLADVVFPVRVLGRLGVTTLVVTNAAGAINALFRPGELMVIEDHVNLLGNPLVGPNEDALGPRFPDMSEAYDRPLRDAAQRACAEAGVACHRGVYVAMTGPSYETPAEIRMLRGLGAQAVGMSTVPEVIALRHMQTRVAALSCITNMAAGLGADKLDHREVEETAKARRADLQRLLAGWIVKAGRA